MKKGSLLIFLSILSVVIGNHVALIGPLISKGGNTFKAFLSSTEFFKPHELGIYINCTGQPIVNQRIHIPPSEAMIREVEMKLDAPVTDSCEFGSVIRQLNAKTCSSDQIPVIIDTDIILMIQTDKPVYRPSDVVTYQIVAMNTSTLPIHLVNLEINVYDGENKLVASDIIGDFKYGKYGFYQGQFQLADEPNLGEWTLKIKINNLGSMENYQKFKVESYNLPPFKTYIETNPKIVLSDRVLTFKVFGKYSFDRFVKGKATINAAVYSVNFPDNPLSKWEKIFSIAEGGSELTIDLKRDLGIRIVASNLIIVLTVEFEEENTGISVIETCQVKLLPDGKHTISLKRSPHFRPGFQYRIGATVTTTDGAIENSTSIPLTMSYKFDNKPNVISWEAAFLKEGKANFEISIPEDTEKVEISFEFDQIKITENIEKLQTTSQSEEFIQIRVLTKEPKIAEDLTFEVQTNSVLTQPITVLVFGGTGIISSKTYPEAIDQTSLELSFKVDQEMAPEADVFVFYISSNDGSLIFDQFKIKIELESANMVTINTFEEIRKPREIVKIQALTLPGSLVALLAVDQSLTFLGTDNIISKSQLIESFAKNHKDYPYEILEKHQIYEKINAFKISPTGSRKHQCNSFEQSLFSTGPGLLSGWSVESRIMAPKQIAVQPRRNFPHVWFNMVEEMENDEIEFNKTLPDSITTWIINGFSINPIGGFAVAEPHAVKVFQDFFIKVEKPYSVRFKEIVSIKVIVYNYQANHVKSTVTLKNQKNQFVFINSVNRPDQGVEKILYTQVMSNGTAVAIFKIQPKVAGEILLEIQATSPAGAMDVIEETLLVETVGINKHETFSGIINLKDQENFTDTIEVNKHTRAIEESIEIEAFTTANLIGPALNNVEKLISLPEGCGEQKTRKFATALLAKRYLDETQQLDENKSENLNNIIGQSLQEIMALQNDDGSFNLWGTNSKTDFLKKLMNLRKNVDFLDLTALIVKLLAQYEELNPKFDKSALNNAIIYINSRQKPDGSFSNQGQAQFRDLDKFSSIPGVSLTAYILIGILESEYLKSTQDPVIKKGLLFIENNLPRILNSGTNYERALTFYLYVLANKNYDQILEKLKDFAINKDDKTYWELRSRSPSDEAHKIEVSSYVALGLIKLREFDEVEPIVKFLISKQSPQGGFKSTTDTVIALQALTELSKALYAPDTNIEIFLRNQFSDQVSMNVSARPKREAVQKLPSNTRNIEIAATGKGVVRYHIFCSYREKLENFQENFELNVTPNTKGEGKIALKICVKTKRIMKSNMAVMEVNLPSGYKHHSGPYQDTENLKRGELKKNGQTVILYFEAINPTPICFTINAIQYSVVENCKGAEVTIYDYYQPELIGIQIYNI